MWPARPAASCRSPTTPWSGAIRNISVERGYDPREFALVAYGGAGPMHAIEVANLLGSDDGGGAAAPGDRFRVRAAGGGVQERLRPDLAAATAGLRSARHGRDFRRAGAGRTQQWLETEGVASSGRLLAWSADLRYEHQGSELTIPYGGTKG